MYPLKRSPDALVDSETYPLGQSGECHNDYALAVVALSHTPVEQRLYAAMLSNQIEPSRERFFTARGLTSISGIQSLSTIRRGLGGLLAKLSIERNVSENTNGKRAAANLYKAYQPAEIIERRKRLVHDQSNLHRHLGTSKNGKFERAVSRVAENSNLSRREAQVALCCVEGLTNSEIGARLSVSQQTVKFHLRHIFIKFGVKRRAELISMLLA